MSTARTAPFARPPPKADAVLRACFFAVGLWVLLGGLSLAFVERCSLRLGPDWDGDLPFTSVEDETLWLDPPLWASFAATSLGAVMTLYAAALPWRPHDDEHFDHFNSRGPHGSRGWGRGRWGTPH
ncbi:hypothetical protein [Alienimonas chondri]|uniref:Uncharacterized protein n=1 Tax=Alienimonas chondri TaxID=2681879 RepID=A0ABX1V6Q0_9PLAN|nr:hypothetical protein [Alienimonas chondri]NNJ23979.1 hypothetical protein [Alienimonas chondri]